MNINILPETDYNIMQQFFQNGGTIDNMPPELLRVRLIWKRADEIIRKFPYYNNERIANQLISDFPEYNLSLSTAKRHVSNAKKYFDLVETETPATHRRILTELAYKQIALLENMQIAYPNRAHMVSKIIENWHNRIASINKLYDKEIEEIDNKRDITVILSGNELDFDDVPKISDKELYKIIDEVADFADLKPAEKQKIIDKDVKGKIL